ncbi:MAG: GLUG motif-containing protein, partial [Acutalibacteraceae bacterium]|nr:GLUG motif-containing protein [Acutalibacteraceae bacterium]
VCKKVCEHTYENGFCKACDSYQPATLTTDKYDVTGDGVKDTVYEISNGGQFYWFYAVIYNGYGDAEKDSSANAVLTNNIWVNKDVIVNGALNPNSEIVARFRSLTIAKSIYNGTFDGQNHTISGLYYKNTGNYVGTLFKQLSDSAIVKNLGVVDSYYWTHEGTYGMIACKNYGTIDNCWSDSIACTSGVSGAMIGENYAVVKNCRNYGVFNTSDSEKYGCYGGIVGINFGGLVENCINHGTINASYRVGGIVGYNEGIIRNCYNIGTVGIAENTGNARGGISGYTSDNQNCYIENCYNIGKVVGGRYFVGGIVGEFFDTAIIQNCYYLEGCAIDGSNVIQNGTGIMAIGITKADKAGVTISSTAQQFASGEVAYLLGDNFGQDVDNGTDVQKYPTFTGAKVYQIINCKNETAYSNTNENNVHKWTKATCTTAKSCSVCNLTEGEPLGHKWFYGKCDICGENCLHTYENGFCSECDRYEPATLTTDKYDLDNDGEKDEVYEISNAGQLYWFADAVNYEGYDYHGANAVLTENINVNAGYTFSADGTVTKDGKTVTTGFRLWDGIGNNYMYSGIFDGQNHTISGLYCDVGYRIGLFGMICDATIKNVGIVDSYLRSSEYVGSVVGYSLRGIVTNCYNTSIIIGGNKTGGIVGYGDSGVITDCYNTGTIISETEKTGGIVGDNANGFVTNCYYLDTCGATGAGTLQTAQQFASGEVAYLLGSAFGQNIGKDNIPVLGGNKVYQVTNCKNEIAYSNTNEPLDHNWLEATCTTPKCCSVCNNIIGEKLGHSYDNDCDADCNRCGDIRVPAQHRYLYNCDTNCDECGALTRPTVCHQRLNLTACYESMCMFGCGTVLPAVTEHIYDNNCDTSCNKCGRIREDAEHTEEIIPGYKATCTAGGLTDGKQCSVCGITILTQQPIPPLSGNHNYENGTCTICGDKEPQITPPTEPTIKTDGYYVIGDINLKLTPCGTSRLRGTIALQPGTYNIKLNNYGTLLGYKKTVTNSSNGMTFKASYSSYVTLNATGGTY